MYDRTRAKGAGRTLALHRPDAAVREEDPLQHLAPLVRVRAVRGPVELAVGVVVLREVEQDRGGLEDGEVPAGVVDERGDAPVWVDGEEPRLLLLVSREVDLLGAITDDCM